MDDVDGGSIRRVRCIFYPSKFVDDPSKVDVANNIYLLNPKIDQNFVEWRYALMKHILEIADEEVPEPDEVAIHSTKYVQRENRTSEFFKAMIEKTDNQRDKLKLKDVWEEYKFYCAAESVRPIQHKFFKEELTIQMGEEPIASSHGVSNFWKGYRIRPQEEDSD
jgi:hypothetical protein